MEKEEVKNRKLGEEWRVWEVTYMDDNTRSTLLFDSEFEADVYADMKRDEGYYYTAVKEIHPTLREALELVGTTLFRNKFHPNTWINAAFVNYKAQHWVFTDGRFINEAQAIKDRGGVVIKLERETEAKTSIAEEELRYVNADYHIINNGSLDALKEQLEVILRKEGLI